MNNKIFFLGIAAIGCHYSTSYAGAHSPVRVIHYEAEGNHFYEVQGCNPNSDVAFYSETGGGKVVKNATTDNNGCLQIAVDNKFKASFVLNVSGKQTGAIPGNGMVSFIGDKEFTLNDLSVRAINGNFAIEWKAAVSNPANYVFEVLKSTNESPYTVITTILATGQGLIPYFFNDEGNAGDAVAYKIRITDKNTVSYISKPILTGSSDAVNLFPTTASDKITIKLNSNNVNRQYNIINTLGQLVKSGVLTQTETIIAVDAFAPGNYIAQIANQHGKATSVKFVKQ